MARHIGASLDEHGKPVALRMPAVHLAEYTASTRIFEDLPHLLTLKMLPVKLLSFTANYAVFLKPALASLACRSELRPVCVCVFVLVLCFSALFALFVIMGFLSCPVSFRFMLVC